MVSERTVGVAALAVVVAVSAAVGVLSWRRRPRKGARTLALAMAGVVAMNLGILGRSYPVSLGYVRSMNLLLYLGIELTVLGIVLFAVEFAGFDGLLTRRTVGALSVEPLLTLGFVAVNPWNLFYREIDLSEPTYTGEAFDAGVALYAHVAYSYVMLAAASGLILYRLYRSESLYRRQSVAILVAVVAPWAGNVLYLAGVTDYGHTVGLGVMGVALFLGLFRFRLVDVTPVARATVVDELDAGVVVLDDEDRVIDVNDAAVGLLDLGGDPVGRPAREVFADYPELRRRYGDADRVDEEVAVATDDGKRFLRVRATPFSPGRAGAEGRVFLVDDVTERRRRERELERQNERLDEFASLVSHDLRNPLNVAQGYLDAVEPALDDGPAREHLAEVRTAHDRMEALVEDMLALAREGERITDTEPTDLDAVATEAWRTVDTADADLTVGTDRAVMADPDRLRRVFENCYRNAVEHGGEDVCVRVGDLGVGDGEGNEPGDRVLGGDVGFYVADDGPGIPEGEREAVFEAGHTTAEEGTGLGLSIVESVVEAHGWTVRAAESEAGGARFEVGGVVPADADGAGPASGAVDAASGD